MANPEHVDLVLHGAEAIAEWRRTHPNEQLDLAEADLSLANLVGADLRGADLEAANLSGAVLHRADLSFANVIDADLSTADLSHANLIGAKIRYAVLSSAKLVSATLALADLTLADLDGADFESAELGEAYLEAANLENTRFHQTHLGYTRLTSLDLSTAIGLEAVIHDDPSVVGVDTLITSVRGAGNKLTPELRTFFRGAGVPKELLDALPDIVREVEYYSCFISYGQPDLKFAEKLREDLKGRGTDCWLYEKDKTVGKRAGHEIVIERRGAEKMVVLCSAKALVRDRFLEEIEDQINEEPNKMVPISLDDLWKEPGFRVMRGTRDLKPFLLDKNYADFANKPYEEALDELLKGLRRPKLKKTRRSRRSP
jgi:GNAT superfamily N-acetyltransferase